MRYFLAAILACAVGIPAASALPAVNASSLSASKANVIVQVAKHGQARASHHSRGGGGIHPLVGSGDY